MTEVDSDMEEFTFRTQIYSYLLYWMHTVWIVRPVISNGNVRLLYTVILTSVKITLL